MASEIYFREDIDRLRVVAYLLNMGEVSPCHLLLPLVILRWVIPDGTQSVATQSPCSANVA